MNSCTSAQFKDNQEKNICGPLLQDNVLLPDDFAEYIYAFHYSKWIDAGRTKQQEGQSVFFTAVNPTDIQPDRREVECDLDKPRIAPYAHTWRAHHNTVNWCNLKLVQRKGLQFHRTRSHAITLSSTLPAIGIDKVVCMKTRELLQNFQVTQVTSRNTCAELARRSEGCTCFRIEKIR